MEPPFAAVLRGAACHASRWLILGSAWVWFVPSPADACWGDHPKAERAYREGIEAFKNGDFSRAIDRIGEARKTRATPDGNCTVQLYGRGRDKKAYYLPYYYIGMAYLSQIEKAEDRDRVCSEAKRFRWISLKWSEDTYDAYESRLSQQISNLDRILEACGEIGEIDMGGSESNSSGFPSGGRP